MVFSNQLNLRLRRNGAVFRRQYSHKRIVALKVMQLQPRSGIITGFIVLNVKRNRGTIESSECSWRHDFDQRAFSYFTMDFVDGQPCARGWNRAIASVSKPSNFFCNCAMDCSTPIRMASSIRRLPANLLVDKESVLAIVDLVRQADGAGVSNEWQTLMA